MQNQRNSKKKPSRSKYIILAVIIFLCILTGYIYMVVTWTPIDSESRKASEAIIRQVAAKQLNRDPNNHIDPNNLTDEDFAKITNFRISSVGIGRPRELSDINLLEKFANLQNLDLRNISFPQKDIPSWMKILANLGALDLSERFSLDLRPLEKLTNLQKLSLWYTHISNLEPLKKLINLQNLHLGNTSVSDLRPIKGLTKLQELNLTATQVSNLEPLKNLKNLQVLIMLSAAQISNLEPLKELTNLQLLDIQNTQVSNLEPIKDLSKLRTLVIGGTPISNLEPIKECKNLKLLGLNHCPNITDEQVEELQKALPNLKISR